MSEQLKNQTPAEIDTILFPILEKIATQESHLANYRWLLGEVGRKQAWSNELKFNDPGVQQVSFEKGKEEVEAKLAALNAEALPYEEEFEARPWSRFVIVNKMHKRNCHTLTPGRTMVGQVAEASGLDEQGMIGKYDVVACTHCFPNAPVEEKKTAEEEGFCKHSGEYVKGDDWKRRYVRCECGEQVSVTKAGKLRKHKEAK